MRENTIQEGTHRRFSPITLDMLPKRMLSGRDPNHDNIIKETKMNYVNLFILSLLCFCQQVYFRSYSNMFVFVIWQLPNRFLTWTTGTQEHRTTSTEREDKLKPLVQQTTLFKKEGWK